MSFKLALDIGYFDPNTYRVARAVEPAAVQQAIVQAGGWLPNDEHPEVMRRRELVTGFEASGRPVLGFFGPEWVLLHPSGFLMIAVGGGSNLPLLAFLRLMVASGCEIMTLEEGIVTASILEQFAAVEERFALAKSKVE